MVDYLPLLLDPDHAEVTFAFHYRLGSRL